MGYSSICYYLLILLLRLFFNGSSLYWVTHENLFWVVLQIYGIKTLVKSYLPVKDAHLRPGIDELLGILRNMLSFGEMSEDLESR